MTVEHDILSVTPRVEALAALCRANSRIDEQLYRDYDVKRGLRDIEGRGVLAGLTNISDIISQKEINGERVPCEGELYYRGINIHDLVDGFMREGRKGYEEVAYLLLFGELPNAKQLIDFKSLLAQGRTLPTNFTRDVIMKAPTHDMMNSLSRSVLTLASYDNTADDISLPNVLRQCLMLISVFPMLAVYSYHAYNHYTCGGSMYIHYPSDSLSTASNFLRMLRPDMQYTPLEASVLDLALVLHMEHGGGNNSSFTTHVVTSSGTDTYSAISAALGSLKGPKHGGANYKVVQMFDDMKRSVTDNRDDEQVAVYLRRLLRREAFDGKGLIYGMGHAVYSISDPRAQVFRSFVGKLAHEKGRDEEFALYEAVERLAPRVIAEERKIYKGVSANVDFYSGLVYSMLGLPPELYTPMFATARIVGWSAHRLEELINTDKIIRPAYRCVLPASAYTPLDAR
ncbi:MAG: citrate/2-methylcitrate synthase [Agathobaculum sp.]|uniref:citrate/2-methylcitrate synthase n=1 Tax=Agathobaculum sp. TaxID=2048138 RepID=UPI0025BAE0A5|nr:citrate/2-methylcitrate synthase [Agathobaculum sp.]MCI7126511.1 citrate/2-methylcitrate synthase [Agathobaculum sp.]MDY3711805.1 citrate/2-methylcitrate synthase [Agathobaculum sp.]